ncbi:DNA-binding response regulator [bacterium]|nr:DNA-binding response regulator [Chloroflexi bacterium CFX6]RIL10326.1 MAG: DNA-binding response regulator [bacterium]
MNHHANAGKPANILVVDDDANLLRLLRESLEGAGYQVMDAGNGLDGIKQLYAGRPDLVVLDVMMPRMDGWETLARIREMSDVPVIMLTARDDEADRLRGFELGADDYVTKPFSLAELTARARAVLARAARPHSSGTTPPLVVGDLVIDFSSRRVLKHAEPLPLTPTEYRLLSTLAEHIGRTLSHEQLLERVWGPEYVDEPGYIKRYIWYLRQKVEDDPANPRYVETVRGFGYRLAK